MTKTLVVAAAVLAACSTLLTVGGLPAAATGPTISVSSTSGLLNGQFVSVSGAGFLPGDYTDVVECSNAAGQPTVNLYGFEVGVSCDSPLNGSGYPFNEPTEYSSAADGTVDTSFVIQTGIIGPPILGIDSAGRNSAADGASYPCPPTPAQQAAGATCELTLGDTQGNSASVPISFGSPVSTSPSVTVSPSVGLANDDGVTVNGTGFTPDSPWLVLECNLTPGEPVGAGGASNLPTSCDQANSVPSTFFGLTGPAPPSSYVTDQSGAMSTTFTIAEGNIGGTQQSATYPCPPSAANMAAGGICAVLVEDGAAEQASYPIQITGPPPVPTLTVSPSTGLIGGTTVQVDGENLAPNQQAGAVECNGAPGQPTISYVGISVPVSCSVPQLFQTSSTGSFSYQFTIVQGVTGPPTDGTDSTGGSAATDAIAYPCPPTRAQQAAGISCDIGAGDLVGDKVQALISFATTSCTGATADGAFICALYQQLFARPADAGGLTLWETLLAAGASRSQVAYDLATSPEYRTDLINGYYETFFGRAADPGGFSHWVGELNSGASDQSVIETMLGSAEYYTDSGHTPGSFVMGLYGLLLHRTPRSDELNYWAARIDGGASRASVAASILASPEYQTDFIEAQYAKLLSRAADPGGLLTWLVQLAFHASYESVIAGIAGSAEFYSITTGA